MSPVPRHEKSAARSILSSRATQPVMKHWARLFVLQTLHASVYAQTCYYPNGDASKPGDDYPCSSEAGSACCPKGWQCLDNGLCYLGNQKFFGRYTCTDKSWKSSSCLSYCTTDKTDSGNQAVLQCANHADQYCCDHNRDENNVCCDKSDSTLFFSLPQGKSYAFIAADGYAVADSGANPPSPYAQTSVASASSAVFPATSYISDPIVSNPVFSILSSVSNVVAGAPSPASTSSTPPVTSSKTTTVVHSSTQSNQNGQTSVVLLTSVITTGAAAPQVTSPAAATDTTSTPNKSSNAAAIGGGVGGGAAALLLLSALVFFLVRRRRRRKERELDEATMHRPQGYLADQKDMDYMYKGQNGSGGTPYTGTTVAAGVEDSPELDGTEVMRKPSGRGYRPGDATRVETNMADTGGNGLGLGPQSHRNENRLSELVGSSPTTGQQRTFPAQGKWERYEQAGQGR